MLKTVENLGVSYVKNSEQYMKKLETEFLSLNFPLRTELVRTHSSHFVFVYLLIYLLPCGDTVMLRFCVAMFNVYCIHFILQHYTGHSALVCAVPAELIHFV